MRKIIIVASLIALAACTDEPTARRALEMAGYTDITVGGYSPYMCGHGDQYSTKFTARNPAGRMVEGAVCSGWSKGATIRF